MNKLSTGQDSTLGNWLNLSRLVFGENSPASKFLESKIHESPDGENGEVLADEGQLLNVLVHMHKEGNAAG